MAKEQSSTRGPSRRTVLGILVPAVLVAGYFGVRAAVRAHVDGVIQASVGAVLPPFDLPRADGAGRLTAADLRGRKVLLHFFRSHCASCEAEAPAVRNLEAQLDASQVAMVHVMTDRVMGFDPADTQATLEGKAFLGPVLMADEAFMDQFHKVAWSRVTPVTYVVDRQGTIRLALRGRQTESSLREALARLP
jgi:peroxiredoxin